MKQKSPIAVVSMAGLFPGATDLETFWHNIVQKVNTVREIPTERWIPDLYHPYGPQAHPDKAYSTRACLLDDYRVLPGDVDLDPDLLNSLDPLHHLVLGAGKTLLSQCDLSSTERSRIGISLAAIALPTTSANKMTTALFETAFEEKLFQKIGRKPDSNKRMLSFNQCQAARVCGYPATLMAQAFDIKGAAFTLDAACASSIYAVKMACDALQSHESDAMIVGGVSRPDNIFTQVGFSQLRALSPSGRCAPFDENADGLVVGEGIGLMVLKRLDDAMAQKDTIHGVICGIGLSNDMSGNLLAPDKDGQIRAMKAAYENAGWQPTDVDLIECHGAGTPVGDLVELSSLDELWKDSHEKHKRPAAIGSVKSMIGHLLTGAGAAGMIKTLLAFKHKTLPPSANFSKAPKNSPLYNSPFKVQTEPEDWITRDAETPRRAAVSAFGFGGINGHLLLEEWVPGKWERLSTKNCALNSLPQNNIRAEYKISEISISGSAAERIPIAIVGMGAAFGSLNALSDFQEAIFNGKPAIGKPLEKRWKGIAANLVNHNLPGAFIPGITINPRKFHIPPNEIPDMLPQQLLMLKTAGDALTDANLPLRGKRPNMGAIIGIGFDFETTNFFLRWNLYNKIRQWNVELGLNLSDAEQKVWCDTWMTEYGPPLTASRTLGNLGSIVASRIAREFQFGGTSYTVSNEEASGLTALKLGVTALQQNELETVLVGAVDFSGDLRSIVSQNFKIPYSSTQVSRPFDASADGPLPGEGSVALVIKRLDDAIKDHHKIYAVIKAMGSAGNGKLPGYSWETYAHALEHTFSKTDILPSSVSLIETHGSGSPDQDTAEAKALNHFLSGPSKPVDPSAIGALKPVIGHTGAVSGLASLVKTALCVYQEIIPKLCNYQKPYDEWAPDRFHMPGFSQYWVRNNADGPRKALVGAMTIDGHCEQVLIEEMMVPDTVSLSSDVRIRMNRERKKPLGLMDAGLFVICGSDKSMLIRNLDRLASFISRNDFSDMPFEAIAREWYSDHAPDIKAKEVVCIVAANREEITMWSEKAKTHVLNHIPSSITARSGFSYAPNPLGSEGTIAFVYPGSGNHYLGMGRDLATYWPEVVRSMDGETAQLKHQILPECYVPWRLSWEDGWEKDAENKIISDAKTTIFGQVVHGDAVTRLVRLFDISPHAVIGYSLGQSVGYFATKAWPDKSEMLDRIATSDLFTQQLAGPCESARKAWNVPPDQDVGWTVAVVNRSADMVRTAMSPNTTARLLIINTYDQCVIGGRKPHVLEVISVLNCDAVFLDGVVTVHCDAAGPVADAYRDLHVFPVTSPENITYYSCADGKSLVLTSSSAADSICRQAVKGFDFTKTIENAYADGVRIFLEMGPHASCTGMIRSILKNNPHVAVSACFRGENGYLTILKFLGTLISEHIPANLDNLYGKLAYPEMLLDKLKVAREPDAPVISIPVGGKIINPAPVASLYKSQAKDSNPHEILKSASDTAVDFSNPTSHPIFDFIRSIPEANQATVRAHEQFLEFSLDLQKNYANTVELQAKLLMTMANEIADVNFTPEPLSEIFPRLQKPSHLSGEVIPGEKKDQIAFSREACLEFAVGSVAKVLGPEFAVIDTYEKRVRLPDEPLMLVDRILFIEGEKRSLAAGRIVTEHDVLPGAWYLDAGKAPVCISVEAGQADLFLCSFLGVDHEVKGKRAYRLLDATVEFHRSLPEPGDTIRYDINIDRFVRQGETYLFFFNFKGYIANTHLITMTNGCAGFFTEEEVNNSGGIIIKDEDRQMVPGINHGDVDKFIRFKKKSISDSRLNALRKGNLEGCFGKGFEGITLMESLRLPSGPMKLIDRILELDPNGGRYGLGKIVAEADIHPDDWFLTCHFQDDMVMPGTLMYECCAHTFRIFLQQMGWISDNPHACYEPVIGTKSVLKCRGPVTPQTQHVHYEVELKEIGFGPEPYAIADAHMVADGHRIVLFNSISLKLSHVTAEDLRYFWQNRQPLSGIEPKPPGKPTVFDRKQLEEFALGKPSKAFGDKYAEFDEHRFIARLPNPPFLLMDRVVRCEPQPWVLKSGGWIEAVFDVSEKDWYFEANRTGTLPYVILLEIALQPCGWLAAYMGSALKSKKDLKFRNLDGKATLVRDVYAGDTALTIRARCTQVSTAGDMIIQQYDFSVKDSIGTVYEGDTTFGFFTQESMAQQKGIPNIETRMDPDAKRPMQLNPYIEFPIEAPVFPEDGEKGYRLPHKAVNQPPSMPSKALLMIDGIDTWLPDGGSFGLGFIRGVKNVKPSEWFFKAHFFQDPVCPGSLGIESFIQLLKFAALEKWGDKFINHHFEMVANTSHTWTYRGQIIPENKTVIVEAVITDIKQDPHPMLFANGYLKVDGKYIYEMKNYGICIKPN